MRFQMSHQARQSLRLKTPKSLEDQVTQPAGNTFWSLLITSGETVPKPKPHATIDTSAPAQSAKSPTGRHPRTPRRPGQHTVRLEALDDSLGPLGPLGENATAPVVEQPPAPPQKEQQTLTHNIRSPVAASQSSLSRSMLDSVDLSDEQEPAVGPRIPPPVQPSPVSPVRRETQPSVSIEQAAKPTFDISVGDPHKVGDLTSAHIVYLVKTKVRILDSLESKVLITIDIIKSLSPTRICRYKTIPRFPMALQLITCKQPWYCGTATSRETSYRSI